MLSSDIKVKKYIASDICKPLIELWNLIKNSPLELCNYYKQEQDKFILNKDYYYEVRDRFNKNRNCKDFLFLLRTCANGTPRFNKKHNFNTSVNVKRNGIRADKLKEICLQWSELLNKYNVDFIHTSYQNITPDKLDFMYLDPPYMNTTGLYYGGIDIHKFFDYLKNVECKYLFSFDGKTDKIDNTYDIPKELYTKHIYIKSGLSSFRRLNKKIENQTVYESLYVK